MTAGCFEPDGDRLLLGEYRWLHEADPPPHALILDPDSGQRTPIESAIDQIESVDWSPQHDEVALAGSSSVEIWNIAGDSPILRRTLQHATGPVSFSKSGNALLARSTVRKEHICVWDLPDGDMQLLQHQDEAGNAVAIRSFSWSNDGEDVVTIGDDSINIWRPDPQVLLHSSRGWAAAWDSRTGTLIATAQYGRGIIRTPRIESDSGVIQGGEILLNPTGRSLAVAASDSGPDRSYIEVFTLNDDAESVDELNRTILEYPFDTGWGEFVPRTRLAWSDDGQLFTSSAIDSRVVVWRIDEPTRPLVLSGSSRASVTFNHDGTRLLTIAESGVGTAQLWYLTWPDLRRRLWQQIHGRLTLDERMEYLGEDYETAEARVAEDIAFLEALNRSRAEGAPPPEPPRP